MHEPLTQRAESASSGGVARSSVAVRAAVLAEDREAILGVLTRNFVAAGSRERFEWLYRSNPAGTSLAWVAEDTATGAIVGTTAAHFKEVILGDRVVKVLNLSDFAFDQGYRSPGYALRLLKASLAPVESGELELAYDHPSPAMAALYKRLRQPPLATWRRYVRRLRVDDIVLQGNVRKTPLVSVALFGVHLAVRLRDRFVEGRSRGLELRSGLPSPAELDRLNAAFRPARIRLSRGAAYVKWRFLDNVTARHEIIAAYGKGGRLAGYVIHRPGENETVRILDLVAAGDERVGRSLLGAVLAVAHARRKRSVAITTLANGPAERVFESLGFWRRQEGPGVFVTSRAATDGRADPGAWWLVEGDEDV